MATQRLLESLGSRLQGTDLSEHTTWVIEGSHSVCLCMCSFDRHTGLADRHVCWRESCNAHAPGCVDRLCDLWRQGGAGDCGCLQHFPPDAVRCHYFSPALELQAPEQFTSRPDAYRGCRALLGVSCRGYSKKA